MEGAVHVRICRRRKVFGRLDVARGRSIRAEKAGFGPSLLILLLILDKGIALLGL